jgi:hypothetical protein
MVAMKAGLKAASMAAWSVGDLAAHWAAQSAERWDSSVPRKVAQKVVHSAARWELLKAAPCVDWMAARKAAAKADCSVAQRADAWAGK